MQNEQLQNERSALALRMSTLHFAFSSPRSLRLCVIPIAIVTILTCSRTGWCQSPPATAEKPAAAPASQPPKTPAIAPANKPKTPAAADELSVDEARLADRFK